MTPAEAAALAEAERRQRHADEELQRQADHERALREWNERRRAEHERAFGERVRAWRG